VSPRIGSLARDTVVYGVLDVTNRLVAVFLVPLYTRLLVPADFGAVDLATTFITVMYALVMFGMDSAVTHHYNTSAESERRSFTSTALMIVLATSSIAAAVLLALRGVLATRVLPDAAQGRSLLTIAAATLPLMAMANLQILFLRITFRRKQFAFLSLSVLVTNVTLNFVFLLGMHLGARGILLAQFFSSLFSCLAGVWMARDFLGARFSKTNAGVMLRYGAPLIVGNVAFWLSTYLERYALGTYLDLTTVGLYAVAAKVAAVVTMVSSAIDYAWMPFALSIQKQSDAGETYARVLLYYVILCGFAGTLVTIFAREILLVVTGAAYHSAYWIVGPLVVALLARGVTNIVAIASFVSGRTMLIAHASAASVVVQAALLFALVPIAGPIGAATATVVARCIAATWIHLRTKHLLAVPYRWGIVLRSILVFVAAAAIAIPISRMSPATSIGVKLLLLCPAMTFALIAATRIDRDPAVGGLLRRFPRVRHSGSH